MSKPLAICIFCGAKTGNKPIYEEKAQEVADEMIRRGHTMVYGGGSIGLMGVLADRMLAQQGKVIGVIPFYIDSLEVAHQGVQPMIRCQSMYERKKIMEEHSDAFFVLPGGFGTFDEMFEFLALAQLKQHHKPVVIYNFNGFFQPLLEQVNLAVEEGFIHPKYQKLIHVATNLEELFAPLDSLCS